MILSLIVSEDKTSGIVIIVSALIHELGHILAAKIQKIKLIEITFDFAGAKIVPECGVLSYKRELCLLCGGPLFNIMFAVLGSAICFYLTDENMDVKNIFKGIFSGLLQGGGEISGVSVFDELNTYASMIDFSYGDATHYVFFKSTSEIINILSMFIAVSLSQAAINLLPIKGLDGGNIADIILSNIFDAVVACKIINSISFICTIVLWIISLYFLLRSGVGIGLFAFSVTMFIRTANSFLGDTNKEDDY